MKTQTFPFPQGLDIESFEVFEEKSGRDCDGEYFHGGHSGVMTNKEIHEHLGHLTASFTKVHRENGEHWNTWSFTRDTEEGYDYVQFAVKHYKEVRDELD